MEFHELQDKWKILVTIGIISIFLILGLTIFIILIFKTDLISMEFLLDSKANIDEYDNFFKELDDIDTTNNTTELDLKNFNDIEVLDINKLLQSSLISDKNP